MSKGKVRNILGLEGWGYSHIHSNLKMWDDEYQIDYFIKSISKQLDDTGTNIFVEIPFLISDGLNYENQEFIELKSTKYRKNEETIKEYLGPFCNLFANKFTNSDLSIRMVMRNQISEVDSFSLSGINLEIKVSKYEMDDIPSYEIDEYEELKKFIQYYLKFFSINFMEYYANKREEKIIEFKNKGNTIDEYKFDFFDVFNEFIKSKSGIIEKDFYQNMKSIIKQKIITERCLATIYDEIFSGKITAEGMSDADIKNMFVGTLVMCIESFIKYPWYNIKSQYKFILEIIRTSFKVYKNQTETDDRKIVIDNKWIKIVMDNYEEIRGIYYELHKKN